MTRIDELPAAGSANAGHEFPAMLSGVTQKLTVGQVVDLIVGGAPGTLDTLNELAAALGDDENFAATVTAALAARLQVANDLSDLNDVDTALTNLGFSPIGKTLHGIANAPEARSTIGAGRGLDWLQTTNPTSANAVVMSTGFASGYDDILIRFDGVVPSVDGDGFRLRIETAGGVLSGSGDYSYSFGLGSVTPDITAYGSSAADHILINGNVGNGGGEFCSGEITIYGIGEARYKLVRFEAGQVNASGALTYVRGHGLIRTTDAITAARIEANSGYISGKFNSYGYLAG